MPFRFRRSISIFKGVRLNLGKRGFSLSLGRKGLSVNLSNRGTRTTVGLPGTGLSYTTSPNSGKLPYKKSDTQGETIDVQNDKPDGELDSIYLDKVDNLVDGFHYSDDDSSDLNVLLTITALVFIGGSTILGLLYLFYYFFLSS